MKSKNFWFIAVLGIAITSLFSCEKEDPIEPVVIDSEVLDSGCSDEVTAAAGTDGTTLSYVSWIEVRQEFGSPRTKSSSAASGVATRSSTGDNGGTKISVTLNNTLSDVNKEIVYDYPEFDNPETSISFRLGSSSKDGFVTVYDSILAYTVSYDAFSFDYELVYQVPVYDDGVTKQVMPYYRYENIRNGETTVADGESRVVNGKVYAVKSLRHSIDVDFNGETYTVNANITLLRRIGDAGQPYIVKSEVVGSSITPLSGNDGFLSVLSTKQSWSDGRVVTSDYQANLIIYAYDVVDNEAVVRGTPNDLELSEISVEADDVYTVSEDGYIALRDIREKIVLQYNFFEIAIPVQRAAAYYDDGVLQAKFPSYEYTADKVSILEQNFTFSYTDGSKTWYEFYVRIRAEIGGLSVEGNCYRFVLFAP